VRFDTITRCDTHHKPSCSRATRSSRFRAVLGREGSQFNEPFDHNFFEPESLRTQFNPADHTHREAIGTPNFNEVRILRAGSPRPDRPQRNGEIRVPEVAPLPGHRQDFRRLPRLRDRPCGAAEAQWRGRAGQHAVADNGGGEGEGQGGVGHRTAALTKVSIRGGRVKKEVGGAVAGGVAGTGVGVTGSVALVSVSGATTGLSGAGIMSGLAAIGGTAVGGIAAIAIGTAVLAGMGAYGGFKLMTSRRPRS
jgi:hypothetical protein